MGEMQKLTQQQLDELRARLKKEQEDAGEVKSSAWKNDASALPVTVSVSEDRMTAWILIDPTCKEEIEEEKLLLLLKKNQVVCGMDLQLLKQILSEKRYGEKLEIAHGCPSMQGSNGYFEMFFDTEKKKKPVIRPDGTVDYSSMGRLANVHAGEMLARYHQAVSGRRGYTVTGAELIPAVTKELPIMHGKNVQYDNEKLEYTSTVEGKVSYTGGRLEVMTVHTVDTDVDLVTGKVEFFGDIIIRGNVEAGVVVRAGRNLTIEGTVGSARLFAGGDIVLKKGIQGGERGCVSAKGSVFAEFIEYAQVDAGVDIRANSIINSKLNAGNEIVLNGKRGSIIGGYANSLCGISANTVGNINEMKTLLHCGYSDDDYRNFAGLLHKEQEHRNTLTKIVDEMTGILQERKNGKQITEKIRNYLLELNHKKDEIYHLIDEIVSNKKELEQKMSISENASIMVKSDVFRGTIIMIDAMQLIIENKESYVRFYANRDQIKRAPYGM